MSLTLLYSLLTAVYEAVPIQNHRQVYLLQKKHTQIKSFIIQETNYRIIVANYFFIWYLN